MLIAFILEKRNGGGRDKKGATGENDGEVDNGESEEVGDRGHKRIETEGREK